jgi:hypothetical protein
MLLGAMPVVSVAPCRWEISLAARYPETTRGIAPYKTDGGSVQMRPGNVPVASAY